MRLLFYQPPSHIHISLERQHNTSDRLFYLHSSGLPAQELPYNIGHICCCFDTSQISFSDKHRNFFY